MSFGYSSRSRGNASIAQGHLAEANADHAVAIGTSAVADAFQSLALGVGAEARGQDCVALGSHSRCWASDEVSVGSTYEDGARAPAESRTFEPAPQTPTSQTSDRSVRRPKRWAAVPRSSTATLSRPSISSAAVPRIKPWEPHWTIWTDA